MNFMEPFEEIPFESFQHICRSCLSYSYLYPITKIETEEGKFDEILQLVTSNEFDSDTGLPQGMCKSCVVKFYDVHRFLRNYQNVQNFLKNKLLLLSKNKNGFDSESEAVNIVVPNNDDVNEEDNAGNETEEEDIQDPTWSCNVKDDGNSTSEDEATTEHVSTCEEQNTTSEIQKDATVIKYDNIDTLVDKIQQLKSEISILKDSAPRRKVPRRRVPADNSDRASTIKRVKIAGPPFVCAACSESFDIYMALRKHWQMYNHHPKNYKCTYCPVAFRSNCVLQQHIRTHTGEKPNVCNICNRRFNHRSNFRRHMYTHSDLKRYQCKECDQGFNRLEFLKDHQRKYHTGEKLLCPYCGKEFTCQGTLKLHEKQHINQKTNVVLDLAIPYQCKTCGKILASEQILNEHQAVHIKKKSMKREKKEGDTSHKEKRDPVCEHCQTVFKNSYELRLHRLDSACSQFVQRYSCSQCDKIFITYGALYAHLKLHREEYENHVYECEICHEQFYKERRYKDHVKRHTRERKFVCSDCGQRFYIRLHLENHMRTHTGERPFACDICHKAFALKVNLTVHMRTHNNIRPFKCCICNHDFRDVSSLRKHSKRYHNTEVLDIK